MGHARDQPLAWPPMAAPVGQPASKPGPSRAMAACPWPTAPVLRPSPLPEMALTGLWASTSVWWHAYPRTISHTPCQGWLPGCWSSDSMLDAATTAHDGLCAPSDGTSHEHRNKRPRPLGIIQACLAVAHQNIGLAPQGASTGCRHVGNPGCHRGAPSARHIGRGVAPATWRL